MYYYYYTLEKKELEKYKWGNSAVFINEHDIIHEFVVGNNCKFSVSHELDWADRTQ